MLIDVEALREVLIDRAGSAVGAGFPLALGDVTSLEDATPEELINEAGRQGLDLAQFEVRP